MALVIPCVKGRMGNTDFYQAKMSARDLVQGIRPASELDEWTTMSIEERLQREPDPKRIKEEIAPYIAQSKDRFFGSMIVLIYRGEIYFDSIKDWVSSKAPRAYQSVADDIGVVTIQGGSLIVLDGQHRLLALRQVIMNEVIGECREEVPNDDVCVIFINHESNEKTRRIFNKVNRYAKPTSRGDNIITSEDDRSAIIARRLLSEGAPLGVKTKGSKSSDELIVEWKNNTLAARSIKLTTISVVYETVKLILKDKSVPLDPTSRPTEEELDQYYELVEKFWNTVLEGLQPYKEALNDSSRIPQMRKDDQPYSLLFKSIGQLALFRGLIAATYNNRLSLSEAVQRANKIDWQMTSDIWINFLIAPSGTMLRGEQPPVQAAKLIEYLIAADKITQEEIKDIHLEYNKAHGVNIDEPDVKLMPLPKPVVEPYPKA
ncbi:DNA sulfur modification protein DndB [Coleofasciculus sp. FACHB-501]|uniref:DNA sulfur modification protein DndB n=1 Tax=Cyanophyceae TaxID=3028117 RepID=UPI0016894044|nr:DNA sulfur modification protein DndB [Coleofasciculus sp. FACHB-501]MBD1837394.1 DGQHR domain-containing protein [Coleofasciculus sp. FACHB-501]